MKLDDCWQLLDQMRRKAKDLESALDARKWQLLPARGGLYCAQRRARKPGEKQRPVLTGRTPAELLAKVQELDFPLKGAP